MKHKFGIIMFVQGQVVGNLLAIPDSVKITKPIAEEDPFCYDCGQKFKNARGTECPGPSKHSKNAFVKDYGTYG